MNLSAQVRPPRYGMYDYLVHDTNEISHSSTDDDVDVTGYAKIALSRSSSLYSSAGMVPVHAPISSKNDLESLVKMEKSRSVGTMFDISGKSNFCGMGIGKIIKVKLPRTMDVAVKDIDRFLIRKVVHVIDEKGNYYNRFDGFVSDAECIPMEAVHHPLTGPQVATVVDNEDSKGRIKVQFQWQKLIGKNTNWLRVQTPDAGNSDKGPRGSVFIPETGDEVMVGFTYGDPNRPYVMGSMFPENVGVGGGAGNKSKSLTTRSGNAVKLDDDTGEITIVDQTGNNLIHIDGKDTITVTATKSIILTNTKSSIILEDETITINAKKIGILGDDEIILASKEEVLSVASSGEGEKGISGQGKNVIFSAKDAMSLSPTNSLEMTSKNINSNGSVNNVIEGGIVKINS